MRYIYKFKAMSTPCEIVLYCNTKTQADETAKAILSETKRLENKYNYYNPNSILSKINTREKSNLDFETKLLLQRSKHYYHETNGLFDITIATIKEFYSTMKSIKKLEEKREDYLFYIGCEHFKLNRQTIQFDNHYTKIDLGGFVKEYAVDRAVAIVKKRKITSAIINFGGDIYAHGKKPNEDKFKIAIKNPKDKNNPIKFIEIENQALTTSASYERNYKIEDKTYSHIISKQSQKQQLLSATVISKNCVDSGVYSTILMINSSFKVPFETFLVYDI